MADHTGKLRCTLTCWGLGLLAGAIGTVMLGLIGGIGWNGAVFLGVLMFVGLGFLTSFLFCRPLPTMAEVQARHAAYRQGPVTPAPVMPAAAAASPVAPGVVAEVAPAPEPVPETAPEPEPAPVAAPAPVPETAPAPSQAGGQAPSAPEAEPKPEPEAAPAAATIPASAPSPAIAASPAPAATATRGKPAALSAPLATGPDNLKEIKGVGPKLEQLLHKLGIYHFSQIAAWGPAEVAWMDENLEGFRGRVSRDAWVDQARILASGAETEFSRRVEDGDVY